MEDNAFVKSYVQRRMYHTGNECNTPRICWFSYLKISLSINAPQSIIPDVGLEFQGPNDHHLVLGEISDMSRSFSQLWSPVRTGFYVVAQGCIGINVCHSILMVFTTHPESLSNYGGLGFDKKFGYVNVHSKI